MRKKEFVYNFDGLEFTQEDMHNWAVKFKKSVEKNKRNMIVNHLMLKNIMKILELHVENWLM